MLLGPVFSFELLTAARRKRNYGIRFIYGTLLLFFICRQSPSFNSYYYSLPDDELTSQKLAEIGQSLFSTFLIVQSIAVLLLTPAMVAGLIADEKQRKTLHYLLASSLSSFEIIVGKLTSRMLQLGVLLLIGVPIISLLSLFGGVDPLHIVLAFAATVTTAFFLSSLAILVSVHAKRPREAITFVYLLEVAWLFVPSLVRWIMPAAGGYWVTLYEWIRPVNEWVAITSPFHLISGGLAGRAITRPGWLLDAMAWMCGCQVVYGLLFVLLSVFRLRPVYQKQGDRGTRGLRWLVKRGRFMARPECGDDAMMWKERYVSRTSVVTKVVAMIVGIGSVGLLAYFTVAYFAYPAFKELLACGYGAGSEQTRNEFNNYLRFICTFIYVLWCIAITSTSSGGLTSEREEDTWISLVSTPLSGLEIIRAKMFGAVWSLRWVGLLMLTLWMTGVAAGAVHPIGLILVVLETAIFVWFVTALGTYLSLRSATSSRALLSTLGILIFLNGGYLLCCIPMRDSTIVAGAGVTPMIEAISLISFDNARQVFFGESPAFRNNDRDSEAVIVCFLSLLFYAGAAAVITARAIDRFDQIVDRPRRISLPTRLQRTSQPAPKKNDEAKPPPDNELAS